MIWDSVEILSAMDDPQPRQFRAMNVRVADNINPEDLVKLKSMCKDLIGQRDLSKINTPIELFDALEKQGSLKLNNVSFLTYLLENGCINGPTLISQHIKPYEIKWLSTKSTSKDMQRLATFLSDNLGREYRRVLRSAGLSDNKIDILQEDYPRNTKEVIYRGFCECFGESVNASLEDVINALEEARCKNVADRVRKNFS